MQSCYANHSTMLSALASKHADLGYWETSRSFTSVLWLSRLSPSHICLLYQTLQDTWYLSSSVFSYLITKATLSYTGVNATCLAQELKIAEAPPSNKLSVKHQQWLRHLAASPGVYNLIIKPCNFKFEDTKVIKGHTHTHRVCKSLEKFIFLAVNSLEKRHLWVWGISWIYNRGVWELDNGPREAFRR